MIDKQLIQDMNFSDFLLLFNDFNLLLSRLDAFQIRDIVGDRPVDQLEDKFIRLVLATYRTLLK